jgi:hypothetical protein
MSDGLSNEIQNLISRAICEFICLSAADCPCVLSQRRLECGVPPCEKSLLDVLVQLSSLTVKDLLKGLDGFLVA